MSCQKENGPHPQGVCRIRKRHSRQRLRNGRSKEKMPGANLRIRTSSLKYGDLLRQFRLGEELPYRLAPFRSLAMVWPPRVRFGGNLVGGSGHRFLLVPLALPWCALGRLALSHRRSSGSEKRRKSIRQAATNLPPHPTRGEVSFKCQIPARAGRRCPILVGTHSEDPRIEATVSYTHLTLPTSDLV